MSKYVLFVLAALVALSAATPFGSAKADSPGNRYNWTAGGGGG